MFFPGPGDLALFAEEIVPEIQAANERPAHEFCGACGCHESQHDVDDDRYYCYGKCGNKHCRGTFE